MRIATLAAIGTAAYAAFLVALLPASYVAREVQERSSGMLQVHEASGTLWKGTGRATIATPAGPVAVERLAWRFLPARLFSGRLGFDVEGASQGFAGRAEVARTFGGWEALGLRAEGKASGIGSFMPLVAHWRPEGTLAVEAPRLAWDEREMRGEARLEWRAAALALSEVRPLGTYRAEIRGDGGPAKVTLQTLEGPLRLAGQGTLAPSRLTFSGDARGEAAQAARLAPLLDLMGPPRADGSRALEWRTR